MSYYTVVERSWPPRKPKSGEYWDAAQVAAQLDLALSIGEAPSGALLRFFGHNPAGLEEALREQVLRDLERES
jgi:hypothetical protein